MTCRGDAACAGGSMAASGSRSLGPRSLGSTASRIPPARCEWVYRNRRRLRAQRPGAKVRPELWAQQTVGMLIRRDLRQPGVPYLLKNRSLAPGGMRSR